MATGDIYKMVTTYIYLGEEMTNVWHYRMDAGSGDNFNLHSAFLVEVIPNLLAIQSVGVEWLTTEIINYDNPADFGLYSHPGTMIGQRAGEQLAPFCTWSFRLNRTSRVTRNGQKRIGGVSENDVQNGAASSGVLTPLDNAAIKMGETIANSGSAFVPVIVRLASPGPSIPELVNEISEGVYVRFSTQNSRKFD